MRGAKMLATAGVMANEVLVTCIQPLQPGDEKLRDLLRGPDGRQGPENPLAQILRGRRRPASSTTRSRSRFDENDAVLYFDDVKVPWERVFVFEDIEMCQTQFHATPAHVYQNYQLDDPPDGEAALPGRHRAPDRRDQRHDRLPAGAARLWVQLAAQSRWSTPWSPPWK